MLRDISCVMFFKTTCNHRNGGMRWYVNILWCRCWITPCLLHSPPILASDNSYSTQYNTYTCIYTIIIIMIRSKIWMFVRLQQTTYYGVLYSVDQYNYRLIHCYYVLYTTMYNIWLTYSYTYTHTHSPFTHTGTIIIIINSAMKSYYPPKNTS